jgi:hypothetical protein
MENTCACAARSGHLEILKWARFNGCPWDENTYEAADENGDPALVSFLEDQGFPQSTFSYGNHGQF